MQIFIFSIVRVWILAILLRIFLSECFHVQTPMQSLPRPIHKQVFNPEIHSNPLNKTLLESIDSVYSEE